MQAVMETLFDTVYLISVITIGIVMIRRCKGERQFRLFGWMAVVLGAGDSFHLVPRAVALCTTGLEHYTAALGAGKWITSITMTVFYLLLYHVWRKRYQIAGRRGLTAAVYGLAGLRVLLCMMPQNQWLSADAPLSWGTWPVWLMMRCKEPYPGPPRSGGDSSPAGASGAVPPWSAPPMPMACICICCICACIRCCIIWRCSSSSR